MLPAFADREGCFIQYADRLQLQYAAANYDQSWAAANRRTTLSVPSAEIPSRFFSLMDAGMRAIPRGW